MTIDEARQHQIAADIADRHAVRATASLVVVCSVISQAQTFPAIWRFIEAKRAFPLILPGVLGVPLGTVLLSHLDTRILKLAIGGFLLLFSAYMLFGRSRAKST